MRKIVYTNGGGTTCIVHPIINTFGEAEDFTEADAEKRAWDKLPKDAINPTWANEKDIPTDRTFRNAWKPDLSIDLDKAKEIHKDKLRRDRKPLLEAQDVALFKAVENNSDTKAIIAEKQRLRDITKLADKAATLDDLKSIKV